jgi:multiple sugar transport system permease protein
MTKEAKTTRQEKKTFFTMTAKRRDLVSGVLFTLPALIYMLVLVGYPIIQNVILSFKDVNVQTFAKPELQKFVGLQNYVELFTVGSILFQFMLGFALALFFNKKFLGNNFFRGTIMISWLLPVTVVGLLFKFIFATQGGIFNQLLMQLHLIDKPIEWLLTGNTAMFAIIVANIWIGIPFNMMLLVNGLNQIPGEIYESTSLDGANKWQTLVKITIPMIKPAIMSVLTLGFVYTFKVFDLVWVMTKGGPVNATELVSTYSYRLSFQEFEFSKGAAVANVMFVILMLVGFLYIKLINDEEEVM